MQIRKVLLPILLIVPFTTGILYSQVKEAVHKESYTFRINPAKWNCLIAKTGELLVVSPNSFGTLRRKYLKLRLHKYTKDDHEILYQVTAISKGRELPPVLGSSLYAEFPLPDWKCCPYLIQKDSIGNNNSLATFPYLVEFPLEKLWLPTHCEGIENFHGFKDSLNNPRFQGTNISTREFQNRHKFMMCQMEEFGIYLQNASKDLCEIDSMLVDYYVRHMFEMWDFPDTYRGDSMRVNQFSFFEDQRQAGLLRDMDDRKTRDIQIDWKIAEPLIREKILEQPQRKWLHNRDFIAVLIQSRYSCGFSKRSAAE